MCARRVGRTPVDVIAETATAITHGLNTKERGELARWYLDQLETAGAKDDAAVWAVEVITALARRIALAELA